MRRRGSIWGLLIFALAALGGCQSVKLPVVMNDNPSLADVQTAVNQNSAKINSLRSDNATLGVSNVAGWANCNLAYQRPQNVRLIGTANMMGRVVDIGSNDQQFWYWSKFEEPPQISYSSLADYASSPLRDKIPVDPIWFPEALGVVEINPADVIEGPIVQPDKTLLIVTRRQRPDGVYKKYTFIEPKTAAVKRQDVMDPSGQTVVTVHCSEFQVDEGTGAVLPKKLVISSPKADGAVHLDLGTLRVNPSEGLAAALFQMPSPSDVGSPSVDLGKAAPVTAPQVNPPPTVAPAPSAVPAPAAPAPSASLPNASSPGAVGTGVSAGPELGRVSNPPVEIPAATQAPLVASGQTDTGSATARFQTVIAPNENRYMNQSLFAPPIN